MSVAARESVPDALARRRRCAKVAPHFITTTQAKARSPIGGHSRPARGGPQAVRQSSLRVGKLSEETDAVLELAHVCANTCATVGVSP